MQKKLPTKKKKKKIFLFAIFNLISLIDNNNNGEMMMKGVEVKCRVINWNNVKGKGERGGEEREEFQYYKHK